jgi:hypothetical protein
MMMVDHAFFMGFTQWTAAQEWLYGFFGYITAAEGFYFLSGLVCSLVFHRSFLPGATPRTALIWQRARTIWFWHLVTVVIACLCVILYAADGSAILKANPYLTRLVAHPLGVLFLAPVFLARPPFLDILPLYVHYLAAAPLFLRWFATGRAWLAWLVTCLLWAVGQCGLWNSLFVAAQRIWPDLPLDGGYFDPCAWLLPFILGLAIGGLWQHGRLAPIRASGAGLFPISLLACGFFWAHHHGLVAGVPPFPESLIDIGRLGAIRIVNLVCAITAIGFLITWFGREPMASSNSRRLSFWSGSPISSRRRGSTGIATTGCLRRITSSGGPSRRSRSGTSASGATPRPAGMGATVTARKDAATRTTRR